MEIDDFSFLPLVLLRGEHFRINVILMSALETDWGVIGIGRNVDQSLFLEHG